MFEDNEQLIDVEIERKLSGFSLEAKFQLPMDGIVGVFGPLGCGKSTLINSLAGAREQIYGKITIGGTTWLDSQNGIYLPSRKRNVGVVYQDTQLFSCMSVKSNILYGFKRSTIKTYNVSFEQIVEILELESLLSKKVSSLSGGEKQKIAIARSIMRQPYLWLMDEPFSAMDNESRKKVIHFIQRLAGGAKTPLMIVSHNLDEIVQLCDYLVVMEKGRVVKYGKVNDVLTSEAFAQNFPQLMSAVLFGKVFEIDQENNVTRLQLSEETLILPGKVGAKNAISRLHILASDVSICLNRPSNSSILNIITVRVSAIHDMSNQFVLVSLLSGRDRILACISQYSSKKLRLKVGDQVFAQIKGIAVRH